MISIEPFIETFKDAAIRKFLYKTNQEMAGFFHNSYHGDFVKWKKALERIIEIQPFLNDLQDFDIKSDCIRIGNSLSEEEQRQFIPSLKEYMPWRKGPYNFFGIEIDCEWRSDLKWARLKNKITPLQDRSILDIGCGNGYHCWRMVGEGARNVLGIDPMLHYVMQFNIFNHYLPYSNIQVLPLAVENLPRDIFQFDSVFSMGVLYHRRSPLDHLIEMRNFLSPSGELILETLVIDGEEGKVLLPADRYAKMRNVWFIPSVLTLQNWLKRCGYKHIELVDVQYTSKEEQRTTAWMDYESLEHFLEPGNPAKTIEGYPAPQRAIFVCSV